MQRFLIAANWKMNGDSATAKALVSELLSGLTAEEQAIAAIFPPFPYLSLAESVCQGSKLAFGAQDVSSHEVGAYTGEVSAKMLKDMGCRYVIVGHSERRQGHGETSQLIAEKCLAAQREGLIPIVCVGETAAEREAGQTEAVINGQLKPLFPEALTHELVIAYEPIWAIGTGKTATPEIAQQVHAFIRQEIAKVASEAAASLLILYGGSVKGSNARAILAAPDVNGALVGGASLQAAEFSEIVKCTNYC